MHRPIFLERYVYQHLVAEIYCSEYSRLQNDRKQQACTQVLSFVINLSAFIKKLGIYSIGTVISNLMEPPRYFCPADIFSLIVIISLD